MLSHGALRSEKGLSSTRPPMDGSRSAWSSAVAAPIERPQRPMELTRSVARRCSTTTARSSRSWKPKLRYLTDDAAACSLSLF